MIHLGVTSVLALESQSARDSKSARESMSARESIVNPKAITVQGSETAKKSVNSTPRIIRIGVFSDQIALLTELTKMQKCPAVSIAETGENQMLLEYLIICNMLLDADEQTSFEIIGYPVVPRLVAAISSGDIDVSGFGIWSNESQFPNILRSSPMLKKGEFNKGLYVTAQSKMSLSDYSPVPIDSLVAVSNQNWTYDWQILNCEFKRVMHVDRYEQMFQILARQRADVLPLAFGKNQDLSREEFGIRLLPIKGIKLSFPDSTHVLIAQQSPQKNILQNRIKASLAKLNSDGQLRQWYIKTGVINPMTDNWRPLCAKAFEKVE